MADIVIGTASRHTPQLSSGVDIWPDHAARDQRYPLPGKDARYHTYEGTPAGADRGSPGNSSGGVAHFVMEKLDREELARRDRRKGSPRVSQPHRA
jgi:hypothetical protein